MPRSNHIFNILIRMGSGQVFPPLIVVSFFSTLFIVAIFFIHVIKLNKFIKSNPVNKSSLRFYFLFRNIFIILAIFSCREKKKMNSIMEQHGSPVFLKLLFVYGCLKRTRNTLDSEPSPLQRPVKLPYLSCGSFFPGETWLDIILWCFFPSNKSTLYVKIRLYHLCVQNRKSLIAFFIII
jgi:hypothetical protein